MTSICCSLYSHESFSPPLCSFPLSLSLTPFLPSVPMSSSSSSSSSGNDALALARNRILSSKLYFDVPPSKVPLIYSESYDISFLGIEKLHPFDSSKWGRICGFLVSFHVLDKKCIVEPLEASKDDLLVVHSESYLNSLKESSNVATIIEVPPVALFPNCLLQNKVLFPFRKQVGGTILAVKLAKERGWAINVGGGFHHCSAEKGGGFCAYADMLSVSCGSIIHLYHHLICLVMNEWNSYRRVSAEIR